MTAETFAIAKNLMSRIQDLSEKIKFYKQLPPNIAFLNDTKTIFYDASSDIDEGERMALKQYIIELHEHQLKQLKEEFKKL